MNFQEKSCYFCKNNIKYVDYKESEFLRNFINFQGKIYP
ncbi:TPA: 30S ribosomal protein S18, partial [Candidatus Azambacteria bacterium]|nr:30S ribosomal protein S18 [Candidatus Azambacteria bacterium]HBC58908.1 30S ribosomal protein S18 [Candidatus Azambacteria bacterium]